MYKLTIIVLACLIFTCAFTVSSFAYTYSRQVDAALSLMLNADYEAAVDECSRLADTKNNNIKAEVLLVKGTCLIKMGKYMQARDVLKKAIPYAQGDLAIELYMGIADTYFMQQEYDNAISVYKQLLTKKANESYLAMLYYKLGKAYQKKSKWVEAEEYFGQLKSKFPKSFEAELIKKSSTGGSFFTIQVGCFIDKGNAKELYDDLKKKGYEVYLSDFQSKGQKLYRIRVGQFVSRIAAEYTEGKLRNQEDLPTNIFP